MDVSSRGVSAIVEYDYVAKEPDELDLVKGALVHNIKQMPGGWWEGTLQSTGETGMFPDNFVRVIDNSDENIVTMRDKAATANRRCKVIFSYTQVNDDELSLAVGDVIEFLGEVEEGWWRGRLKNKIGVFPSNFVTVIEPSPILASKRPAAGPATTSIVKAAATAAAPSAAASALEKSSVGASSSTSSTSTNTVTASSTSTKKMNRISFHSSKEDLLNSSNISSSSGSNFVAATSTNNTSVDDVAPSLPPKPQREYCRVEYPYTPQNDDELELKVGEIITIISMELPDKGWWKGELHGKVGVFPDNFVKLLDVTSLSDSQPSQRTAKASNVTATAPTSTITAAANTAHVRSAAASAATSAAHTAAATSKVFIKKSGSNSSTQSSNRKDSFGSYDSLNDILSETGLQSGNVAAQRKSLENKNLDLSANAADASSRLALKKQQLQQQQQHLQETKTVLTNNGSVTTTTTTTSSMSASSAAVANELRKSLESLDEKTKTPPPVLTKKPTVTTKKPSSVTGVASNLFGFGKQKTKSTDSKLTTAASQDFADGMCSSKTSTSGDAVVLRRAATIATEDSDFDRLERSSILTDMRAGRVKAPKRRPPSAAINIIGESNNNDTIYLNGSSGGGASGGELSQEEGKLQSSDENSTGEEQLAKPRPREWEKKKAPWMEELKASQVKKKTSPSVEPRTQSTSSVTDRTSRLLSDDVKVTSSNHSSSHSSSSATSSSTSTTTKVQSSSVSSSLMQQSMTVESSQQVLKRELNSNTIADIMTKSMSNKFTTDSSTLSLTTTAPHATSATNATTAGDDVRARPNSLSIRNRSMSPSLVESSGSGSVRTAAMKSTASPATTATNEPPSSNGAVSSSALVANVAAAASSQNSIGANNHYQQRTSNPAAAPIASDNARIGELERRVGKLEQTVGAQQRTIDELLRLLREETDRVKVLRGELDKYAQCVTQV